MTALGLVISEASLLLQLHLKRCVCCEALTINPRSQADTPHTRGLSCGYRGLNQWILNPIKLRLIDAEDKSLRTSFSVKTSKGATRSCCQRRPLTTPLTRGKEMGIIRHLLLNSIRERSGTSKVSHSSHECIYWLAARSSWHLYLVEVDESQFWSPQNKFWSDKWENKLKVWYSTQVNPSRRHENDQQHCIKKPWSLLNHGDVFSHSDVAVLFISTHGLHLFALQQKVWIRTRWAAKHKGSKLQDSQKVQHPPPPPLQGLIPTSSLFLIILMWRSSAAQGCR